VRHSNGISESDRESSVIKIDTTPGANKKNNRTVMDRLIKNPSHEDFVVTWSEVVIGKGLTFDFFSDPLKWLVLFQDDTHGEIYTTCIPQ
jgi:hypothetical protein